MKIMPSIILEESLKDIASLSELHYSPPKEMFPFCKGFTSSRQAKVNHKNVSLYKKCRKDGDVFSQFQCKKKKTSQLYYSNYLSLFWTLKNKATQVVVVQWLHVLFYVHGKQLCHTTPRQA